MNAILSQKYNDINLYTIDYYVHSLFNVEVNYSTINNSSKILNSQMWIM